MTRPTFCQGPPPAATRPVGASSPMGYADAVDQARPRPDRAPTARDAYPSDPVSPGP
ncbi:MAG: hypothetical protein ACLQPH_21435 [Acidimicrobiales bacterium]